jgi:hypothetical protein
MGRHETRVDLRADPTCDGLSCAAAYALGGGGAGPLAELPEWRGRVKRRWRVEQFVTVMLDSLQPSRPCGLVIGVGAARLFGGRELAAVVESCWAGDRRPAAMLLAADADARLVEWAVAEFPETPLFEATGEGAWRALAKAMDIAGGVRQ